ncbi:MAG: NADH-quinone oxidoreductase subunit J [Desulfobacteraceae bacterium]|nr:NADH-quinone oxidoreductase subunit J [Desulfobacteraceae bacterium]
MDIYFWVFAVMAVGAGVFMISSKDPLPSALGLLTVFIALASLYLHLNAPLVAIFQVTIYAGAILVLVVFVIMLLMTPGERLGEVQRNVSYRIMGAILGLCATTLIGLGLKGVYDLVGERSLPEGFGSPNQFGELFFRNFLLHFEVASVLLLVALIGAIYIAKKKV